MRLREIGKLVRNAATKFWEDGGPRLSASLTFYLFLSLSPVLLTVVSVAGFAFGNEAARGEIVARVRDTVGRPGAEVVEGLLAQSVSTHHSAWSAIVAGATLLIGASGLFSSIQGALNAIWMVPGKKIDRGFVSVVRARLLSFALVGGAAFILLASVAASAILAGIDERIGGWLSNSALLVEFLNLGLSFGSITVLFAMIFKWLPEADLPWSDLWMGAAIASALIAIGRYPIGLYLHRFAGLSAFGAAEALVVFLVWVYYSSQLFLLGAELTYLYATRSTRGFSPTLTKPLQPALSAIQS